jgi:flagellar motor switch protein FliG
MSVAEALKEGVKGASSGPITDVSQLDGPSKCAVVLLTAGAEIGSEVLRLLSPFEVQRLSSKMASVRALSRDIIVAVLKEFRDTTSNNASVAFDTENFMASMLNKALGADAAGDLLGRLEAAMDMSGVEALKRLEPDVLYETIKNEHPQILATIFVFLEPAQSSQLVKYWPDEIRNEILLRVALLEKVQPTALKELNETMANAMPPGNDGRRASVGGVIPTAEILNMLTGGIDQEVLATIRGYDSELAGKIVEQMFTFEDLVQLEDRSLQSLMLEIPQDLLVTSLKGASARLRDKLFKNMAKRAAETVKESLENRGPVKIVEVEESQKEILRIARSLVDEGRMSMDRGGGGGDMIG